MVLEIGTLRQPLFREYLVDQYIAALAGIDSGLSGARVSRDDNATVGSIKAIAIALHRVFCRECRDSDTAILVNDAGSSDFMDVYVMAFWRRAHRARAY